MKLHAWLFALAFAPAVAVAALAPQGVQMTAEEEARALIGIEYLGGGGFGMRIVAHLSCADGGGGMLQIGGVATRDWWSGRVECRGRQVLMLKRPVRREGGKTRWRIVDTLLLPPVRLTEPYVPHGVNDLWLFSEECTLDGSSDTEFFALVRWTDRERIDWQTGVEHAWTFDIKRERIVPVSTKRVVCEQPFVD